MDALIADLRYGLRLFRKSPVFSLVAAGTLALGIGANTVIFSKVDAVVIRALPYDDPDRVIVIWEDARRDGQPHGRRRAGTDLRPRRDGKFFQCTGCSARARPDVHGR